MASTVFSFATSGIDGQTIEIETEMLPGIPSVSIVGLGDKAIKEARERLEAAISHTKFYFPQQKIVFNLAPSDMRKTGTHLDLGMAIGLLLRSNQIFTGNLNKTGFIGELSLNAYIRPVSGVLPMALKAKEAGITKLLVAPENVGEAKLVKGIDIHGCQTLKDAINILEGKDSSQPNFPPVTSSLSSQTSLLDFLDVKGQNHLIESISIAAAGGHNLLMIGPPGCGKSMIAKRIPTILPKMSEQESLEVMKIYSVANLLKDKGHYMTERPFRSPHHNASSNSLIGGGPYAMPGEISLSHNGVLFLDEIAEFSRKTLDSMRQPLEDKKITITRVWGSNTYPANFMLVGAMNPCPCGYFGQEKCRCTSYEVLKYRNRLSGPVIDRMDIQKYVGVVDYFDEHQHSKSSNDLRETIEQARKIQQTRYMNIPTINSNSQLPPTLINQFCAIDQETTRLLQKAYDHFQYSARTVHKYIKIARTIADLDGEQNIRIHHMRKSLLSRDLEKEHYSLIEV
ncbi:YifB family Mg chelatase-like AAA ATPase [Fredinandcohnia quinoae]|uniref:YifB family Mg chelatase-like AAA ATPase n=1 Tax=Fredinandcohnia quinoae TaxID=2918902 RepID=A0AAW5E2Z2_9BACI|nr:YifB family Mg chelatase-like AAA ATPase [Fredinandcohnia sp. SECRCQ15]MCH1625595.1 YifB family Mg chelatase-like AAA ATPase [Fredinandcohnia sp. SECRCQ15]